MGSLCAPGSGRGAGARQPRPQAPSRRGRRPRPAAHLRQAGLPGTAGTGGERLPSGRHGRAARAGGPVRAGARTAHVGAPSPAPRAPAGPTRPPMHRAVRSQPLRPNQRIPVPYSCSSSPARSRAPVAANRSLGAPGPACLPKLDIMFLKTHKTASSTVLNILFRFGEKHRLKFAFPRGRNDFYYPSFFQRSQVRGYRPGACFNVICNHMRLRYEEVRPLLPAGAAFVTVLRDPAYLFESSFHYFGRVVPLTWALPGEDKLAEFLRAPGHYYDPGGFNAHYLRNLLSFDLGYDSGLSPASPAAEQALQDIGRRFHLVMLLEHFDESLVLLRDLLCWELEDILYFKLNARKDSTVSRLTGELYDQATAWNRLDARLYRHFNASFWRKVEAYGRARMARDVAELRRENERMRSICIDGGRPVDASAIQEPSMQPWQPLGQKSIVGYNLKKRISKKHRKLCRKMLTPELQYMSDLGADLWLTKLWSRVRDFLQW
ncbi:galactosylceramide sulfotransferase isoform X2 [Pelodiscus sinensis]|uniref:galactosylceramide sulfotransferase isoform X2 n=1 Tax=Pelodiscus sinensis TaxID=13735 RepID=UPI003F6C6C0B